MASKFGSTLKPAAAAGAGAAAVAKPPPPPAAAPPPAPEEAGFPEFPRINVGGTEFQASLESLRSRPGSLLSGIFTGDEEVDVDQFGRFFFDRDPTYFGIILNYFRTGAALGIPKNRSALEALRAEASFYRVDGLLAQLPASVVAGAAAAVPDNVPSGSAIFRKWLETQSEMNGELAGRLATVVANCLNEGATLGYNSLTLTAYRPPEAAGSALMKAPEWGVTSNLYIWSSEFAGFFSAARGFPILHATRDFLIYVLQARGFAVKTSFDEKGMEYECSAIEGVE